MVNPESTPAQLSTAESDFIVPNEYAVSRFDPRLRFIGHFTYNGAITTLGPSFQEALTSCLYYVDENLQVSVLASRLHRSTYHNFSLGKNYTLRWHARYPRYIQTTCLYMCMSTSIFCSNEDGPCLDISSNRCILFCILVRRCAALCNALLSHICFMATYLRGDYA